MPYRVHFQLTDDLIAHLDSVLAGIDPQIQSRYVGFLSVSAVTVLELALKSIFIRFATEKHPVLGVFCESYFRRINGQIGLDKIQDDYLKRLGDKYLKRFKKRMKTLDDDSIRRGRGSVKSAYGSLLVWRHAFVHQGTMNVAATYDEVKRAYECGKETMHCLAGCLRR